MNHILHYKDGNGKTVFTVPYSSGINLGSGGITLGKDIINADRKAPCDVIVDLSKKSWPLKTQEYNLVVASAVLEHLPDDFAFMKECHRILKRGGYLIISVPHFNSSWIVHPEHRRAYGHDWAYFWTKKDHLHTFSVGGFEVIKTNIEFMTGYQKWNHFVSIFANRFPVVYEQTFFRVFPASHIHFLFRKVD